jgi:hypothetical protein
MTENLNEKTVQSEKGKSRGGCLKIGLIVVVVLLVVLHFAVPWIVRNAANKQLPDLLGTEASLESVSIFLPAGRVGLRGLQIEQPEGFEGGPLFRLGSLSVEAPLGRAIGQNPVTVNHLRIDDVFVRLVSNEAEEINVTRIVPPVEEIEDEIEVVEDPAEVPPVWVKELLITNLNVVFEDLAKDWVFTLSNFELSLTDLRIAGAEGHGGPAVLDGSFEIHDERLNARFRVLGKIGMIQPDQPERVPPIQLAVGLTGFNLDIIDPFMVRGARTALGGGGLDFWLFLEIGEGSSPEEQELAGSYALVTDQNHSYSGRLGGTLERPVLPFLNIFGDVLGNQFGRVTRLGGNVAEGGIEAARAVADTGVAAVRGATGVVTGAAGGLLRTARGVVTLDAEEAAGGLRDTTVGTVTGAADTVTDTARTAGSGVAGAGRAATGREAVQRWWDAADERAEAFEAEAEAWFASRPFPN